MIKHESIVLNQYSSLLLHSTERLSALERLTCSLCNIIINSNWMCFLNRTTSQVLKFKLRSTVFSQNQTFLDAVCGLICQRLTSWFAEGNDFCVGRDYRIFKIRDLVIAGMRRGFPQRFRIKKLFYSDLIAAIKLFLRRSRGGLCRCFCVFRIT